MNDSTFNLPRYAKTIGIMIDHWKGETPVLALDFSESVEGNPGTFHGGAVGELLQIAALSARTTSPEDRSRLIPISVTINYLRAAKAQRIYAIGSTIRAGRRLSNLRAVAWQEDSSRPIAEAAFNIIQKGD